VNTAELLGDLTPIQREILKVIRRLTGDRRRPPCMREVLENVDLDSLGAQPGLHADSGGKAKFAGKVVAVLRRV